MTETFADLTARVRAQVQAAQTMPQQPYHSFWRHQPHLDFPPDSIQNPEQYSGADRLAVICTQTDLPAKQQKLLVEHWCRVLPELSSVRYLWFHSRVPQTLFDAVCQMPNLEGLYVKWSGIESLESIRLLRSLRYLYLGSSASVTSIEPLRDMRELRWLELENIKRVDDLSPFSELTNLEGLGFVGQEGAGNLVKTLAPLATLTPLRWLRLGGLRVEDGSLRALGGLKNLRHLSLRNSFSVQEFAWLSTQLPQEICEWLKPFRDLGASGIRCKTCNSAKVMLSGKGVSVICPACDAKKFQKHKEAYEAARLLATTAI